MGARSGTMSERWSGRPFTQGERRAFSMGFLAGLAEGARQLELFRIRVAGKSTVIEVPRFWPERGE